MKPRELLATARVPGHSGELRCYRHDGAYALWLGRTELMSSRVHESEELLADVVAAAVPARERARFLVGGLGMGFTLARLLANVGPSARVEVVELVPEVVAWNRDWFGPLAGEPLRDARVAVDVGDVFEHIAAARSVYDGILLDVDNGPDALVHPHNERLYGHHGLAAARKALVRGGVLGIWASADDPRFAARLRHAGFDVETHRTRARGHKGPRRTIWTARRHGGGGAPPVSPASP